MNKNAIYAIVCIAIIAACSTVVYSLMSPSSPSPSPSPSTTSTVTPSATTNPATTTTPVTTPDTSVSPTSTPAATATPSPTATPMPPTQQVTDMVGRTVTVSNYVSKIIGVNYGCLRLLTYMNASSMVCGVEQTEATSTGRPYAMAHPEYANMTKIGPQFGGDPELIAAQKPDVVFVTDYSKTSADSLQSQLGIPVISITYGGLDTAESRQTLYESFNLIGKVLHKEERAASLINYINSLVADLNTRTVNIADSNKPTVYIGGLSSRGAHGFTSTCASYAPFTLTNSKNVITLAMANNSTSVVNVDLEALPSLNPQIIFVDYAGMTLIKSDVQAHLDIFNQLTAVTTGKTYGVLNYNSYTTNFEIALADAYYVGSVLYPSQFSDVNPAQKADEIYTFMVGAPIYSQLSSLYGPFGSVSITS